MGQPLDAQSIIPEVDEAATFASITPLQVRGRSFTAVVLRLTGAADKSFYDALEALMRQAPHFFVNAPLVVDLADAPEFQGKADFVKLARQLRARKLAVIGIQNGTPEQGVAAFAAGLTTLQGGRDASLERRFAGAPGADPKAGAPEPVPLPADAAASVVLTEPVRSGQRIFADRGDLVVLAPVSSGAELIAHGNIHVYAPLRGRALAGVNGDRAARIFCQSLEAELVAIAGLYRMSDDLPAELRRGRAQVFLQDDALKIEPLK